MGTTEDYLDKLLKGLTEDGISDETPSNDDVLNVENIISSEHKDEEPIQTTYDYDNGASEAELEAMLDSIFGGTKDSQETQVDVAVENAKAEEPVFESNTISQIENSDEDLFSSLLTGELLENDINSLSDELFTEKIEQDISDTEAIPAEMTSDNSTDRFEELIKNRSQVHTDESAMDALLSGLNATLDENSAFNNTEIGIPVESELNDEPVNNNLTYEEPEINMDEIRVVQTPLKEDFFQGEEPDPKVIEELNLEEFLAPREDNIEISDEIPIMDEMPAMEEVPAVEEMPTFEGLDMPEEISDEMPIMDEMPAMEELPAVEEMPTFEGLDMPAEISDEMPIMDEMPAMEELPAVEDIPVVDEMPTLEGLDMPAEISDEMPIMDEMPAMEEVPAVEDIPVVDEMPTLEGLDVPTEISDEMPIMDEMPALEGFDIPTEISGEMPTLEGLDIPAEISDEMPATEEIKEESFDDIMKQAVLELEPQSEQSEDIQEETIAEQHDNSTEDETIESIDEQFDNSTEEITSFDDMSSLDDIGVAEESSEESITESSLDDLMEDSVENLDFETNEIQPEETDDVQPEETGEDLFGISDEISGFDDMPSLDDLDMPEETLDNDADSTSENDMEDEDIGNLLKEIEEMGSGKDPLSYDIEEELEKASNVSDDDAFMADDMGLSELLSMGDDSDMAEISDLLEKDENNELVEPSEIGLFDENQDFTSDDFDSENMFDGLPDDLPLDSGSRADAGDSADEDGEPKEKKPGLFEKIKQFFKSFLVVPGEDDELEVFAEESAVDKAKEGAKENEKLLDEIDDKKKKKKKEKKEKKPKEKDPEKEKKKKEKEAEKARKKAEKEAKKAAEKAIPTKKLPMKKVIPIFILCISIGVATYLLSSVVPSAADKQKAEEQFKMQNYEEVYKLLRGHVLSEEEQLMFNKSVTIEKEIRKIDSFNNYMKLGMKSDALNSLVQAVKEYDNLSSKAEEYGVSKEVDMYYSSVIKALNDNFAVSEEKAKEWAQISDREEYSRIIDRFIEKGPDFSESEIGNASNAIIDSEEKEINALDYNSSMPADTYEMTSTEQPGMPDVESIENEISNDNAEQIEGENTKDVNNEDGNSEDINSTSGENNSQDAAEKDLDDILENAGNKDASDNL